MIPSHSSLRSAAGLFVRASCRSRQDGRGEDCLPGQPPQHQHAAALSVAAVHQPDFGALRRRPTEDVGPALAKGQRGAVRRQQQPHRRQPVPGAVCLQVHAGDV